MTDDRITAQLVAAMLALEAAEKAASSRVGEDSLGGMVNLAWGSVVAARGALSGAAPDLEAQAASHEPLEAGDCAEYLRTCAAAMDTIGPQADMPGPLVARAYIEDVVREVTAISAKR